MAKRWKYPAEFIEDLPDGTKVEVKAGPADGPFTAAARLLVLGKDKEKWSHAELVDGVGTTIQKDHAVRIQFFFLFFGDATVELDIVLTPPEGPLVEGGWTLSGHRGDETERKLFLFTE